MNLTRIELHSGYIYSSNNISLSFKDPRRQNPYNIKEITGLDADEIVSRFYGVSIYGKSKFHNLVLQKREIALRIELNLDFSEGKTYSDLRDELYKMIASNRKGLIELIMIGQKDRIISIISGYVKKFEAFLFTSTPEVQLTIQCDDPMFKGPARIDFDPSVLNPANAILPDDYSTAPHGFIFEMEVIQAAGSLIMYDPNGGWAFLVQPIGGFLVGDVIHYSSEYAQRYMYIQRGEEEISIVDQIFSESIWPIMFPGINRLIILDGDLMFRFVSCSFYPTYWGV